VDSQDWDFKIWSSVEVKPRMAYGTSIEASKITEGKTTWQAIYREHTQS
jgi:hypothetical protein